MTQRVLQELGPDECTALLGQASVGRLVYVDDDGPVAIPVNYALAGSDIVFRSEPGTKEVALAQDRVAFEVDRVDDDDRSAWSVVVRGTAEATDLDDLPELLQHMDGSIPTPWASGIHSVWIKVVRRSVTGRRLGPLAPESVF